MSDFNTKPFYPQPLKISNDGKIEEERNANFDQQTNFKNDKINANNPAFLHDFLSQISKNRDFFKDPNLATSILSNNLFGKSPMLEMMSNLIKTQNVQSKSNNDFSIDEY